MEKIECKDFNCNLFVREDITDSELRELLEFPAQYAFCYGMGKGRNIEDGTLKSFLRDIQIIKEDCPTGIINNYLKKVDEKGIGKRDIDNVSFMKGKGKLWFLILDFDGIIDIDCVLDLDEGLRSLFVNNNFFYRRSLSGKGLHVFIPLINDCRNNYITDQTLRAYANKLLGILKSLIVLPFNSHLQSAAREFIVNGKLDVDNESIKSIIKDASENDALNKLSIDPKVLTLGRILFNSPHPVNIVFHKNHFNTIEQVMRQLSIDLGLSNIKQTERAKTNGRLGFAVEVAKYCENSERFKNHKEAILRAGGVNVGKKKKMRKEMREKTGRKREVTAPILGSKLGGLAKEIVEEYKRAEKNKEDVLFVKARLLEKKKAFDERVLRTPVHDEEGNLVAYHKFTRKLHDDVVLSIAEKIVEVDSLEDKELKEYREKKISLLKDSLLTHKNYKYIKKEYGYEFEGLLNVFTDCGIPFKLYGNYFTISVSPNESSAYDLYYYFNFYNTFYLQSKNSFRHFEDINKMICGDEYDELYNKAFEDDGEDMVLGIINYMKQYKTKNPYIYMKHLPLMLWQIFKNWGVDFTIDEVINLCYALGFGVKVLDFYEFKIYYAFIDALADAIMYKDKYVKIGKYLGVQNISRHFGKTLYQFMAGIEKMSNGKLKISKYRGLGTSFVLDDELYKQLIDLDNVRSKLKKEVNEKFKELEKKIIDNQEDYDKNKTDDLEIELHMIYKELRINDKRVFYGDTMAICRESVDVYKSNVVDYYDNYKMNFNKSDLTKQQKRALLWELKDRYFRYKYFNYIKDNLYKLDKDFLVILYAVGKDIGFKSRLKDDYDYYMRFLQNYNPIFGWIEELMYNDRYRGIRKLYNVRLSKFGFQNLFQKRRCLREKQALQQVKKDMKQKMKKAA